VNQVIENIHQIAEKERENTYLFIHKKDEDIGNLNSNK
jgi:hypothetical protein